MNKKKIFKWTVLLLLVLLVVGYCFTWPGRTISMNAGVNAGAWILDAEDAQSIVKLLRRPHMPTISDDKLDCMPEMVFTVTDGDTTYSINIHSHTKKGYLRIDGERWFYFYLPPWELNILEEIFQ